MKNLFSLCRSALVLALFVVSIVPDVHAGALPTSAVQQPATTPLETLLNADGTLNLSTGFSGSLDINGWHMALSADGTPHFSRAADSTDSTPPLKPASVPDDAYWDGRFDYPPGVSGSHVDVLAVSGDELYVGGVFTTTGSLRANNIAKWNPQNGWSALGNGLNNLVNALVVNGSTVYAGGFFTQLCGNATCNIGNTIANHVAVWNGSSWSALGNGVNDYVFALAVSGNTVYAGGAFTQVCGNATCSSGNTIVNHVAAWNGSASAWSALGNGVNITVIALAVSGNTVYAGGAFTQVCGDLACTTGNTTANRVAAWNGSSWAALGNGMNIDVFALAVSGNTVYAGGLFTAVCGNPDCNSGNTTANRVAVWNGSSWAALGNGVDYIVHTLAVSGSTLYAGGPFTVVCGNATCNIGNTTVNSIAAWNGSSWAALGHGVNDPVDALAVSGSTIYAGGYFTQVCGNATCTSGNTIVNRIVAWNSSASTWSALGNGANGAVYALAVSGNTLYIGGDFTSVGGVPANRIAAWNGSSWSALGNGVSYAVSALAVSGADVFVGGSFTQVCGNAACNSGNTTVNNIAMWNGSSWSALDNGLNSGIFTLVVNGNTVYAGGFFNAVCGNAACTSGNTTVNYIAVWNGSSWSALGHGVNSSVDALVVNGNTIYVGGQFTEVCGNATCTVGNSIINRVAAWNGSSWAALGNGVNNPVWALAMSGSTLYVGGQFTRVCGNDACDTDNTTANRVAAWNISASTWSALGNGVDVSVFALAVSGNTLYAGGIFGAACGNLACSSGNTSAHDIAVWNGSSWSALGSGINNSVDALSVNGSDLYAGGAFTTAGGKASAHFAHWNKTIFVYLPLIEK